MRTPVETVTAFVAAFVDAWPRRDAEVLVSFFAEDAVYENGPLEPVHGRSAICATLREFMAMGGDVDVDMRHMVAEGSIVMTERVDFFAAGGRRISLPVMGIFEVRDGVICAWRDYFDLNQFSSQMDFGS
jgi:limonene-1,2-epoxide hydrolase